MPGHVVVLPEDTSVARSRYGSVLESPLYPETWTRYVPAESGAVWMFSEVVPRLSLYAYSW